MKEPTSPAETETQHILQLSVRARILLVIGIVFLLIALIAGGIVLSAMRRLRGDEQIPIVSRDSEYVMPSMEESLEYIDNWEEFENLPQTEEPSDPAQTPSDGTGNAEGTEEIPAVHQYLLETYALVAILVHVVVEEGGNHVVG